MSNYWKCRSCVLFNSQSRFHCQACFSLKPQLELACFDVFDFCDNNAKIIIIFGYFRKNNFLSYRIKFDDFISIISSYISKTYNVVINQLGNKIIAAKPFENVFTSTTYICDCLNKQFAVVATRASKKM